MSAVIEKPKVTHRSEGLPPLGLFQVWIDLSFGVGLPDWWWNDEPKILQAALDEAADCRRMGWTVKVMPEGKNPRPDGRWDNP